MAASTDPQLSAVLGNLARIIPFDVTGHDAKGEWFQLKSPLFPDQILFNALQFGLSQIVVADKNSFALIHCRGGSHAGVWLHHLATPPLRKEYLPGCHQVDSWA